MYSLLARFLPRPLAIVGTAGAYSLLIFLIFMFWSVDQAGFRYAEI